jgi:hypothetical protein
MARFLAFLCALALALAVAGCGGGDSATKEDVPALGDGGAQTEPGEADAEYDENVSDDLLAGPGTESGRADERPRSRDSRERGDDDAPNAEDDAGAAPSEDPGAEPRAREDDGAAEDGRGRARTPRQRPASPDAAREIRRAQDAVRRLIDGIARRDASVCTELMTRRYVEQVTGLRGDAAIERCRHDVAEDGVDSELEVFGPAEIKDDRAIVRARVRIGDKRYPRVYDMRRDARGAWRVDQLLQ